MPFELSMQFSWRFPHVLTCGLSLPQIGGPHSLALILPEVDRGQPSASLFLRGGAVCSDQWNIQGLIALSCIY